MTLAEYLSQNDITEAAFGHLLGVSQVTINRYVNGKRFPNRETIQRIHAITNGKVAPADWFEPAEAAE